MSAGWGDPLPEFDGTSPWPMAVVPSEDITLSVEHLLGVKNCVANRESGLVQTSAEWKLHQKVFKNVCPDAQTTSGGSLCFEAEQTTGAICEFEAQPVCYDNRCSSDQLCLSPICFNRSVPVEDQNREVQCC